MPASSTPATFPAAARDRWVKRPAKGAGYGPIDERRPRWSRGRPGDVPPHAAMVEAADNGTVERDALTAAGGPAISGSAGG
ncbi:hypothetical protein Aau02nite_79950 [Amorphoplanes auranticolor]|uniref:Uncharacterized protein n=1 Tax=Actinoplanes auranticolor TaxID=47988 RepID=A0A919VTF2_9ACTN|nr:hypothetical protein Aau02nite_79950 [Actinoplanes auranticolor]